MSGLGGGGRRAGQSEQFPCSPRSPREEVVEGTCNGLKEKGQEEKHFWTMERIGVCVCVCWGCVCVCWGCVYAHMRVCFGTITVLPFHSTNGYYRMEVNT